MCRSTRPLDSSSQWTTEWWTVPRSRSKSGRLFSPVEWPANGPASSAVSESFPAMYMALARRRCELGRRHARIRERSGERRLLDRVELCEHVGLERVQLFGRNAFRGQPRPCDDERVALAPAV